MENQMTGVIEIVREIEIFQLEMEQISGPEKPVSREEFTLLLSGISTCRKLPGVAEHMGYEKLYHCGTEEAAALAREHLEEMYGIHDRKTLEEAMLREFSECEQYEQFRTFWIGAPMFRVRRYGRKTGTGFWNRKIWRSSSIRWYRNADSMRGISMRRSDSAGKRRRAA